MKLSISNFLLLIQMPLVIVFFDLFDLSHLLRVKDSHLREEFHRVGFDLLSPVKG